MRVVCISDTHNCSEQVSVPDGDLLIHSGDATINGTHDEISRFAEWFTSLPHRNKIFVAGNHDWLFERDNEAARLMLGNSVIYLQDSSAVVEGMKVYGSPWQPRFYDWAFNLSRGPALAEKWSMVPDDVEILVTHGPPNGILDEVPRVWGIENTGCEELRKRVDEIVGRGSLKLHVFGHIHCGYGVKRIGEVTFVNASTCDEGYEPTQHPIVIDI
ncbi:MAG: metallophosphatase domain-containing protein [Pyrinomonadaceae bacterium]|nr:metallophosphatase domain-containing protein [Pyrinomonadaceae bacterium]